MSATIQLRRDTAANWTSANPVLAQGELGFETDTRLYKIGNGATAWNALAYKEFSNAVFEVARMDTVAVPSAPPAGSINIYARPIAGRMMLRQQGPSGLATPLQPSFFQNFITMINTNATTSVGAIGNTVTSAGTLSHPAATPEWGIMANFATALTAAATAGTGNNGVLWARRATADEAGGFFFAARIGYPDASYDHATGATGTRTFIGLTNQTMAASVTADEPAGHFCGFFRRSHGAGAQDTNWQFATKNGATMALQNTGLPFVANKLYDAYIFSPPGGTSISWRIDNITDGTTAEGSTDQGLPGLGTLMRAGFQLITIDAVAVARNIRMQRVYCESDR
jgi:hypothetical protein